MTWRILLLNIEIEMQFQPELRNCPTAFEPRDDYPKADLAHQPRI
jgi:hypothetical protein